MKKAKPQNNASNNSDKTAKTIPCPECQTPSIWSPDNPHRPFCSERCKLIDLGKWMDEEHKIEDVQPFTTH